MRLIFTAFALIALMGNSFGQDALDPIESAAQYQRILDELNRTGQFDVDVETDTYRQGGSPVGCGILFSGLVADWTSGTIEPVFISGGLNYLWPQVDSVVLQVKSRLTDIRLSNGTVSTSPSLPNKVYIRARDWTLADAEYRSQYPRDWPQQSLVYPDTEMNILPALATNQNIIVAFNREPNGLDLELELEISDADHGELRNCLADLIGKHLIDGEESDDS